MSKIQADQLILALDLDSPQMALDWAKRLGPRIGCYKIGLQLFSIGGPELVKAMRGLGVDVFLDLKLHDIPNTVAKAVAALVKLDLRFLTLHCSGGSTMVQAAVDAAADRTTLLGVTILTSLSDQDVSELGFDHTASGQAMHLARLGVAAGLHGLVCSPLETRIIREQLGDDLTIVTPGVRPPGSDTTDQNRIATPATALRDGASHLVIGRPILAAADPEAALQELLNTDY